MTEPIDEYVVQQLKEYEGKNLVSITKVSADHITSYEKFIMDQEVDADYWILIPISKAELVAI